MLSLVGSSAAQDELRNAAERYVKLDAVQDLLDFMLGPGFLEPLMGALAGDKLKPDLKSQMVAIGTEELAKIRPSVEAAMAEAAAEIFSVKEIEALIAFYSSEHGASVIRKMQPFNNAYLVRITPDLQRLQAVMEARVREIASPR
ncbi:DUF2059 domain-containing protein [Mesorhizobium sp. J428]|uniref:DUF2059 domain-containing protein n=1 Tax=Mesorhizobium sp. J428 TaxID=2898440 RepID=UPI002150FFD4|nr:DUF2059 domain-containing protein [Mesorhizobium sp. J428]MCR5858559.1 DUF2059 domain-containing protein [Mesorhizobium sp. J428]